MKNCNYTNSCRYHEYGKVTEFCYYACALKNDSKILLIKASQVSFVVNLQSIIENFVQEKRFLSQSLLAITFQIKDLNLLINAKQPLWTKVENICLIVSVVTFIFAGYIF